MLMQADLMCSIKDILFPAAVESIFGATFLQNHHTAQLQQAFFAFEEGFELAASPVPHLLQPSFCKGRKVLLEAFRYAQLHQRKTCISFSAGDAVSCVVPIFHATTSANSKSGMHAFTTLHGAVAVLLIGTGAIGTGTMLVQTSMESLLNIIMLHKIWTEKGLQTVPHGD